VKKNYALPLLLMVVFAVSRWPGVLPANFSAAYALVFCAGLYFPGRLGWVIPLGTLLITDLVLTKFAYHSDLSFKVFIMDMAPNYLGYAGLILLGRGLGSGKKSWLTLVCGGVVGAFVFYIVSNIGAWLTMPQYAKTLSGLIQALTVGLPGLPHTWTFFLKSLSSTGLFTGLFVGAVKMLEASESAEEKREPTPEIEAEPEEAKN